MTLARKRLVSVPSLYQTAMGVHGPGCAIPTRERRDRHIFALDAIWHIQDALKDNPDVFLFDLARRHYAGKRQYSVRAGRERTYLPVHLSDAVPSAFQASDHAHVKALCACVSNLTQREVVALGTHQNHSGTVEAIEYNVFIHVFWRFMKEIDELEGRTPRRKRTGRRPGGSEFPSLRQAIEEVKKKAERNRSAYTTGLGKIEHLAAGGNSAARIVIESFEGPDAIWDASVTAWRKYADDLTDLGAYLKALRNARRPRDVPEEADERRKVNERLRTEESEARSAIERLEAKFPVTLPRYEKARAGEFDWAGLRKAILSVFDGLPGQTAYHDRYRRRAAGFRET